MAFPQQLRDLLFVLNPISGNIDKTRLEGTIHQYCHERGRSATFFRTTGQQDLKRLQHQMRQVAYDAIFAAGGDGTVSLVAEAVAETPMPLGILPLGSGNGLSKDLEIPQALEEALRLTWDFDILTMDTVRVGGRFSAHLADLGFNALIVERFDQGGVRGPGAYVRIATQEYISYEPERYHVKTDLEEWEGPAFMLTIANANTFGSNVVINPDGKLNDGQFEICLIEPFPNAAAPGILYNLYTSGFDDSGYTRRLCCSRATITVPERAQVLVQIDGEPMQLPTPIEVEIMPHSLHVLVPKQPESASPIRQKEA